MAKYGNAANAVKADAADNEHVDANAHKHGNMALLIVLRMKLLTRMATAATRLVTLMAMVAVTMLDNIAWQTRPTWQFMRTTAQ